VRIELVGVVRVGDDGRMVGGAELGGRRARVVLAALALAEGPVPADALATAVWGDELPATWPVALRGTVRGLRAALAPVGGDGQRVIATMPSGYALAPGVEVDVRAAAVAVRLGGVLLGEGRPRAALDAVSPAAELRAEALLPGEDAPWLAPHRAAVDALAAEALDLLSAAASATGEHGRAIDAARRAVAISPLDERPHRTLIRALDKAGDRSGAVRAYEQCRATLADELGVDPSAETVDAYRAATAGQAGSPSARVPAATTSFLGRARELAELGALLTTPGLVTVTGRGGVGKSRLAAVAAARGGVPGGRFWVPLTPVVADELVAAAVALGLDVRGVVEDPTGALVDYLAPLGRVLLVVDGADLVADGAASLAAALVQGCPMLTLLVTSRTPLGVDGEQVLPLAPLPAPDGDDPASVRANPRARLLADRVLGDGALDLAELDPATSAAVAELCRRCDGLPLAIELAAAQLGDMPIGDLLDHLGSAHGDRVRDVASGSYALLDADEAAVFRRFAVLDGPVTLAHVRAVVSGDVVQPARVVRILRELGVRGLVASDRSGPRWLYSQDDDLHRYGRELLVAAGEEAATFDRLLDALCALLPTDAQRPPSPYAADVSSVLGSVRSVFGAALAGRADRDRCLELAFRLHRYWAATSVAEGRFWLSGLLGAAGPSRWRRYATYALGYLGYWAGDTDLALRDLRAAIDLFGDEPDPFVARAYIYTAGLLDDRDRPAEALDCVRRSIAAAEPFATDLRVAAAMGLGSVLSERGDPSAAAYAADAVTRCRADGSVEQLAALLPTAAMVCWQVGALDEAGEYVAEARPMHADHKRIARVVLLSTAAGLALAAGDAEAAVDHGRAAEAEGTELGVEREMPLIRALLARALLRRGDVAGAADRALAGLTVAAGMSVVFPLAVGLETAALVGAAAGAPDRDVGSLLGTAAAIRAAGDRPPPSPLAGDLDGLPVGPGLPAFEAVAVARHVLAPPG
jgi:predicted ATPase/DNA-binding SARP family transcriptional activator